MKKRLLYISGLLALATANSYAATSVEAFVTSHSFSNILPIKQLIEDDWQQAPEQSASDAFTQKSNPAYQGQYWGQRPESGGLGSTENLHCIAEQEHRQNADDKALQQDHHSDVSHIGCCKGHVPRRQQQWRDKKRAPKQANCKPVQWG